VEIIDNFYNHWFIGRLPNHMEQQDLPVKMFSILVDVLSVRKE